MYLFVSTQFRTENRFALFLELLWSLTHQNGITLSPPLIPAKAGIHTQAWVPAFVGTNGTGS